MSYEVGMVQAASRREVQLRIRAHAVLPCGRPGFARGLEHTCWGKLMCATQHGAGCGVQFAGSGSQVRWGWVRWGWVRWNRGSAVSAAVHSPCVIAGRAPGQRTRGEATTAGGGKCGL